VATINIANESTVQEVKQNTETIKTDAAAAKSAAETASAWMGSSNNVGSASGTTLFALIKYIVSMFSGYYTTTRAALLDKLSNLDTTVSSRASQTTADNINTNVGASGNTASSSGTTLFALIKYLVSMFTGTWTTTRAALIDTINANVATVKAQTATGGTSVIKSIQRGTVAFNSADSVAVTISSVNTSKCDITLYGSTYSSSNNAHQLNPYVDTFSSTSLKIPLIRASNGDTVGYQIVEFY